MPVTQQLFNQQNADIFQMEEDATILCLSRFPKKILMAVHTESWVCFIKGHLVNV